MLIKKLLARAGYLRPAEDGTDLPGGGVQTTDDGDVIGTGNDARVRLLEQINDANDQLRADELRLVNDDGTTEDFTALTPSDDNGVTQQELQRMEGEVQDPESSTAEAAAEPSAAQPQKFKLKVNGREVELTQEELIARAQKVEAADQYLAEAAALRRSLEQQQKQNPAEPSSTEDVQQNSQVDLRALVRAIQMGSEDEAMAALAQLQSMSAQPKLSPDDLARTVDERLTFKEAISRFESEYSDILGDPQLRALALQKDQQLLAAGDRRGYWERYSAIGNELREWRDSIVRSARKETDDPLQNRANVKANAARNAAPAPASRKAAVAVQRDEEEAESVSDVIAQIAKARGGPQWSRA